MQWGFKTITLEMQNAELFEHSYKASSKKKQKKTKAKS